MWGIKIDRESELPLWRQIYQAVSERILSGEIKSNEVLPSTRELAGILAVSRNTVCQAYDMLITEGYLISRQGAPTHVAAGLSLEKTPGLSLRTDNKAAKTFDADFRTGKPDLRLFPRFLWQQLNNKALEELQLDQFGYTGPQGYPRLLGEIAAWLYRSRGLKVDPVNIFITAGATHALHLATGLLCGNKGGIYIEDPCHTGMLETFLQKGCQVIPVPVDEQGIQTEHLEKKNNACAIYVTPSHQFPMGGILPATRRAKLMRFAKDNDLFVIEDDYDSEFRYSGEPIAPLYNMDPQRVIYVGTFSKILFPALRIGYVILPGQFHKSWKSLRTHADVQNPPFQQAALAEFMAARKLDRHVRKMRRVYSERRKLMLSELENAWGDSFRVMGDEAGLHLAIEFPGLRFDDTFRKRCLENSINITPVENHCIQKGRHLNKLLLGYGHLSHEEIKKGVGKLKKVIQDY
ncbi:MAG: gabR 2 [Eubacterium sp.]|jgi:GntR family transcriptional regulator/MocR family aminotransferase|nr:gabR 2 [Eubacterium sp.]